MIRLTVIAVALLLSTAAHAQESAVTGTAADPKINTVIVFGDDTCPESTDEQINVCAILVEADRYRIPAVLRSDPNDPRKDAWTNRVLAYRVVGRDGTMSCSASGAGGFTGCGLKDIDAAFAEKDKDSSLAFGLMIAAERKKRLEQIDAEAEAVEQRVKLFEKERADKEARDAVAGGESLDGALPQPK